MRLTVIFAAVLVAAGGLAGCFGSEEEPTTPASVDGNVLPGGGPAGTVNVLAPLKTTLTTTAPSWVKSGTAIDVTATATQPKDVTANVTFLWATGALPGTVDVEAQTLDTGSKNAEMHIQPGAESSLVFKAAGVYEMHCHPHPNMRQNVTVVEGYKGPDTVHVQIVEGRTIDTAPFVPARLVIGPGTKVVYHNNASVPHTATLMTQEPALKLADLAEASGTLTIEGEGWQRVVLIAQDADGRIGVSEHRIYVSSELPTFATWSKEFSFTAGGVSGVAPAPGSVESPQSENVNLEHGGKVFLNWTGTDASGGELADFEIHFTKQGETQDSITGDGASGEATTTIPGGMYVLTVKPLGGVQPTVSVTIEVVYDLVPPEPAEPSEDAGGDDGHGGHAH